MIFNQIQKTSNLIKFPDYNKIEDISISAKESLTYTATKPVWIMFTGLGNSGIETVDGTTMASGDDWSVLLPLYTGQTLTFKSYDSYDGARVRVYGTL